MNNNFRNLLVGVVASAFTLSASSFTLSATHTRESLDWTHTHTLVHKSGFNGRITHSFSHLQLRYNRWPSGWSFWSATTSCSSCWCGRTGRPCSRTWPPCRRRYVRWFGRFRAIGAGPIPPSWKQNSKVNTNHSKFERIHYGSIGLVTPFCLSIFWIIVNGI